jgi:hypothetical protein
MEKQKMSFERYLSGTLEESRARLPETVVDDILKILSLNPNEIRTSFDQNFSETTKEQLWDDLIFTIWKWGRPSPSQTGTTLSDLKKHSAKSKKLLHDSLKMLEGMKYDAVYKAGTMSKEFIFANDVRIKSTLLKKRGSLMAFPMGAAILHKKKTGKFPELYIFDRELKEAIEKLENIIPYFDEVIEDFSESMPGRGKKKEGKDISDMLIYQLCHIYKKYTGKAPSTNSVGDSVSNPSGVTGKVIPFLKTILPYTEYGQAKTDIALMGRVKRLKEKEPSIPTWQNHKIWQNSKK